MRFPLRVPGLVLALSLVLTGTPALAQQDAPAGWRVVDERPVEVDGAPIALSPDGTKLAGTGPDADGFCVWDVATLEPTCDGSDEELRDVLPSSVTWSPDSTAVAFSLDSLRLYVDSDVYVFETNPGTLRNLTPDDMSFASSAPIDLYPSWSPDSQHLVFARTMGITSRDGSIPGTSLMTISRNGGGLKEMLALVPPQPMIVNGTMSWREDGTVLFGIRKHDPEDGQNGIWRTSLDGDLTQILRGTEGSDVVTPWIAHVSADGTGASVVGSIGTPNVKIPRDRYFLLDLEGGQTMPWSGLLGVDVGAIYTAPALSPDDRSVAFVADAADGDLALAIADDLGASRELLTFRKDDDRPTYPPDLAPPHISWAANNTMLVITYRGASILTLAHDGGAATPAATAGGSWEVVDERRIEVDGTPLALSPDGGKIAGLGPDRASICVWDVKTLTPACDGAFPTPIIERSVVWSPDSTAVAFSLDAPRIFRDSDLYVFETATGKVVDLTEDDPDGTGADKIGILEKNDHPVPIDLYPAWSPDSQRLVFARTMWTGTSDASGTTLMTIDRVGGEPETVFALVPAEPMIIYSPMRWLEDDSILFSVWRTDLDNQQNGVWRLGPDGSLKQVLPGTTDDTVPAPLLADVSHDGAVASVVSIRNQGQFALEPGMVYFAAALMEGGEQPWEELLELPIEPSEAYRDGSLGILVAAPVFDEEHNAVAYMTRTMDESLHLSVMDGSGISHDIATIPGSTPTGNGPLPEPKLDWADNGTLLMVTPKGSVLLTLAYTGEDAPGSCGCTPPPEMSRG